MVPRWALRFWPDTRAMVDDVIGLDPSHHGTLDAYGVCAVAGCPVHVSGHLSMGASDPVGYALVIDALTHDGPASAARISRTVCLHDVFLGIDRFTYPANMARVIATAGYQATTYPHAAAEPALAAYAR